MSTRLGFVDSSDVERRRAFRVLLPAVLVATFMGQFDFFVVNVAAPTLQSDLHSSDVGLELIVGGYAFTYAAGLVLGGRLGDIFGHREVFVWGMVGFGLASALCAGSSTPVELIGARLTQGLAAALMLPQVLAVISRAFSGADRPRAMSWFGVAGGAGAVAGQVLGGLLVSEAPLGLSWRLIFWVNVPIAVVGAGVARRVLPQGIGTRHRGSLDLLGASGLAATLLLLLVPLTLGRSAGWPWWAWPCLAASPVTLAVTLRRERSLTARGQSPVVDLQLFRSTSFRLGVIANAAFMAFFASYMFTLALLLQDGMSLSAFEAGLVFAPAAVGFSAAALAAPRLVSRWGRRALVCGGCVVIVGLLAVVVFVTVGTPTVAEITLAALVVSLGNGVLLPSLVGAAMEDVVGSVAGAASGVLTMAQQFAGATGVALVGSAYFAVADGVGDHVTAMAAAAAICVTLVMAVGVLVGHSR